MSHTTLPITTTKHSVGSVNLPMHASSVTCNNALISNLYKFQSYNWTSFLNTVQVFRSKLVLMLSTTVQLFSKLAQGFSRLEHVLLLVFWLLDTGCIREAFSSLMWAINVSCIASPQKTQPSTSATSKLLASQSVGIDRICPGFYR